MKFIKVLIGAVIITVPLFSIGLVDHASAKTLVVCGPNGAARVVEKVPIGCHVLKANTPPARAS